MVRRLDEEINRILKEMDFERGILSDTERQENMDYLFKVFEIAKEADDTAFMRSTAKAIYSGILDLTRVCRLHMADSYKIRFEREIGYRWLERS